VSILLAWRIWRINNDLFAAYFQAFGKSITTLLIIFCWHSTLLLYRWQRAIFPNHYYSLLEHKQSDGKEPWSGSDSNSRDSSSVALAYSFKPFTFRLHYVLIWLTIEMVLCNDFVCASSRSAMNTINQSIQTSHAHFVPAIENNLLLSKWFVLYYQTAKQLWK
jgi:hypothetical protein